MRNGKYASIALVPTGALTAAIAGLSRRRTALPPQRSRRQRRIVPDRSVGIRVQNELPFCAVGPRSVHTFHLDAS
eukprot:COSAG05_NODE_3464_length_2044_cov_1.932648_2_plen_75_part_00